MYTMSKVYNMSVSMVLLENTLIDNLCVGECAVPEGDCKPIFTMDLTFDASPDLC